MAFVNKHNPQYSNYIRTKPSNNQEPYRRSQYNPYADSDQQGDAPQEPKQLQQKPYVKSQPKPLQQSQQYQPQQRQPQQQETPRQSHNSKLQDKIRKSLIQEPNTNEPQKWLESIPIQQKYVEYEPEHRVQYVPVEKKHVEYLEIEHQSYLVPIPKLIKYIEYIPVERYEEQIDYLEVQESYVKQRPNQSQYHQPQQQQQLPYQAQYPRYQYDQAPQSTNDFVPQDHYVPRYNPKTDLKQPSFYDNPPPSGYRYLGKQEPQPKYFYQNQNNQDHHPDDYDTHSFSPTRPRQG